MITNIYKLKNTQKENEKKGTYPHTHFTNNAQVVIDQLSIIREMGGGDCLFEHVYDSSIRK